uniref:FCP1 homology domain-containing protein n=1 Tax=viral metagenome TaxID=1070528 RepID=A0A6M3LAN2_9ZZZZ
MMKIWIDIDNTICSQEKDYSKAAPFPDRIKEYNLLYDLGHNITYWTSRGTTSGIDWRELTEKQLKEWGVKYHDLKFGKPSYDLLICDKTVNPNAGDLDVR